MQGQIEGCVMQEERREVLHALLASMHKGMNCAAPLTGSRVHTLCLLFRNQVGPWLIDLFAPVPHNTKGDKDSDTDGCIEEQGQSERLDRDVVRIGVSAGTIARASVVAVHGSEVCRCAELRVP